MDSAAQLALMLKAKKVFEANDTFLSFPISPLSYKRQDFDFLSQQNADAIRQSVHNLTEFSTLVNFIPRSEAWQPVDQYFLWDAYKQILQEADFAFSTRTSSEETAYQLARAYLKDDGSVIKSYRKCKDAYFIAEQEYTSKKITAENGTEEQRKQWKDVDEPQLRANLDELKNRWIVDGYKKEVELAQSTISSLGANSPFQTRDEWRNRFNFDIDQLTDPANNRSVFVSSFSPINALEEGSWGQFKLSEQEVKALLSEAPVELRTRLGINNAALPTISLTFEFSSAVIMRSWFTPEVFRSHFWRFTDANRILSDGNIPPTGICPAYVTAIVFARRVAMEETRPSQPPAASNQFNGFNFNIAKEVVRRPEMLRMEVLRPAELIERHRQPLISTTNILTATSGRGFKPRENLSIQPRMLEAVAAGPVSMRRINITAEAMAVYTKERAVERAPIVEVPPLPPVSVTPDDTIYILGFICKRIPKCPDADMSLQW